MKLNLIPKTAAKGAASKGMFLLMLGLVLGSLALAFLYNNKLQGDRQSWEDEANSIKGSADEVVRASREADEIVAKARIVLTNKSLYDQIQASNQTYPDLYDDLIAYIPSFMRVRTFQAQSAGAQTARVTIGGYLKTFQQYSDVMISLLRFPKVQQIGRAGFGPVPEGDEGPFAYSPDTPLRGAIPGWSAVTITLVVATNLQAPDARRTLQAAASGQTPSGGGGGTPPPAGPPTGAGSRTLPGGGD
jgi:hypothetical protein